MNTYRIADVTVQYAPQYPMLAERSEKYRVADDPAAPVLAYTPEDFAASCEKHPALDLPTTEYMLLSGLYYRYLLLHGGMMLHASAVVVDNAAYLFSAASGTGKSTHTGLWLQHFGDRAYILNDDKPAMRVLPDGVYAYGTPFSGKYDISVNRCVPVRGIAFLSRDETNSIEPMRGQAALYAMLNQTVRPREVELYLHLLRVLNQITKQVPIYALHCNMEPDAVLTSYSEMVKGKRI